MRVSSCETCIAGMVTFTICFEPSVTRTLRYWAIES